MSTAWLQISAYGNPRPPGKAKPPKANRGVE